MICQVADIIAVFKSDTKSCGEVEFSFHTSSHLVKQTKTVYMYNVYESLTVNAQKSNEKIWCSVGEPLHRLSIMSCPVTLPVHCG